MGKLMRTTLLVSICMLASTACASPEMKYELYDDLYSVQNYHPANRVEMIAVAPENNCELEQLRRMIITLSMYSNERHGQTYLIDLTSPGGQIISESFSHQLEKISDKIIGRGDSKNIKLKILSDALREVNFECVG